MEPENVIVVEAFRVFWHVMFLFVGFGVGMYVKGVQADADKKAYRARSRARNRKRGLFR